MQRILPGKVRKAKRKQVMPDEGFYSVSAYSPGEAWSGHSQREKTNKCKSRQVQGKAPENRLREW